MTRTEKLLAELIALPIVNPALARLDARNIHGHYACALSITSVRSFC